MAIFYMRRPRYSYNDRWPETEASQYYDTLDFWYYEIVGKYHTERLSMKHPISISFVLLDIDECLITSHACDVTANCTNTDGSYNCTCKEGYTGDGESCRGIITALDLANTKKSVAMANMIAMLIPTVRTQMVLIFVLAKKDTLEIDSHIKVNKSSLHYLKQAALHISFRQWRLVFIFEAYLHAPLSYTLLHHL